MNGEGVPNICYKENSNFIGVDWELLLWDRATRQHTLKDETATLGYNGTSEPYMVVIMVDHAKVSSVLFEGYFCYH